MKCPNGKHDGYCAEEDSVMDFSQEEPVQECAKCVMEERNNLRSEMEEARKLLLKLVQATQHEITPCDSTTEIILEAYRYLDRHPAPAGEGEK